MSSLGAEEERGSSGWVGWKPPADGAGADLQLGPEYSRFLKTPRKVSQDKGSHLEQPESQEQDRMDFKEEMLEVSP